MAEENDKDLGIDNSEIPDLEPNNSQVDGIDLAPKKPLQDKDLGIDNLEIPDIEPNNSQVDGIDLAPKKPLQKGPAVKPGAKIDYKQIKQERDASSLESKQEEQQSKEDRRLEAYNPETPKPEEPKAEEPKAEEPKAEEPKAEQSLEKQYNNLMNDPRKGDDAKRILEAVEEDKKQREQKFKEGGQNPSPNVDPYKVLGLDKNADMDQVQKQYKAMQRKFHPDLNKDNKEAANEFAKHLGNAKQEIADRIEKQQKQDQTPQQPKPQQPEQPKAQQPEQPKAQQPEQPKAQQPEQPSAQQPEQPSAQQPQQPQRPSAQQAQQPQRPSAQQPRAEQPNVQQSMSQSPNPNMLAQENYLSLSNDYFEKLGRLMEEKPQNAQQQNEFSNKYAELENDRLQLVEQHKDLMNEYRQGNISLPPPPPQEINPQFIPGLQNLGSRNDGGGTNSSPPPPSYEESTANEPPSYEESTANDATVNAPPSYDDATENNSANVSGVDIQENTPGMFNALKNHAENSESSSKSYSDVHPDEPQNRQEGGAILTQHNNEAQKPSTAPKPEPALDKKKEIESEPVVSRNGPKA
jgi:hypothetical protein